MTGNLTIKNGKFYIILNMKDPQGVWKKKWISTGLSEHGNKRAAEKLLKQTLQEYEKNEVIYSKNILFSETLEQWLEAKKMDIRMVSWKNYNYTTQKRLIPYFKKLGVAVQDVRASHIQTLLNQEYRSGLKAGTIQKMYIYAKSALDYACRAHLIPHNPCAAVVLPKREKYKAGYYRPEQLKTLLGVVKGTTLETPVFLTVYYGLRRSEVAGLQWKAVDFENESIHIFHTALQTGTVAYMDATKSESSRRVLPLMPEIKGYLLQLKTLQERQAELFGNGYQDSDYICRWPDGHLITPDWITVNFKKLLIQNNLPIIRFHDLRHSCASLLLNLNHDLKSLAEWLGHADIATTSNIYTHVYHQKKVEMGNHVALALSEGGLVENMVEKSEIVPVNGKTP